MLETLFSTRLMAKEDSGHSEAAPGWEGTGVRAQGTSRGGAASAGGPKHQGLTGLPRLRLRPQPPSGSRRTSPRSLPSAPQSPPVHLLLCSAEDLWVHNTLRLLCHLSLFFTYYSFHIVLISIKLNKMNIVSRNLICHILKCTG